MRYADKINSSEEEYPGYNRRTFRCQSCDGFYDGVGYPANPALIKLA